MQNTQTLKKKFMDTKGATMMGYHTA